MWRTDLVADHLAYSDPEITRLTLQIMTLDIKITDSTPFTSLLAGYLPSFALGLCCSADPPLPVTTQRGVAVRNGCTCIRW